MYISKQMCSLLSEYSKECGYLCSEYEHQELTADEYLFRQPGGLPMTPTSFTYRFNLILKKYNLPKELTVHSLRHTNASLLISQNVDVRTVASLLGHSQPSTTLDIYSHAFDKNKKEAQEKLKDILGL